MAELMMLRRVLVTEILKFIDRYGRMYDEGHAIFYGFALMEGQHNCCPSIFYINNLFTIVRFISKQ